MIEGDRVYDDVLQLLAAAGNIWRVIKGGWVFDLEIDRPRACCEAGSALPADRSCS